MNNYTHLIINKNRGWRGLAEVTAIDLEKENKMHMIFSFSQAMWEDLINNHTIVMQDKDIYYVIRFEDESKRLPRPDQQRSVLIKNFNAKITKVNRIKKAAWRLAEPSDWTAIKHFIENKNNHTTSDWNCIGLRVMPTL